jgi:hypothetical protein
MNWKRGHVQSRESRMRSVGHLQQLGGIRLVSLEDGAERGVRVLEFRTTEGLEFGAIVDRALDIGWCRFRGRSVAWHSPTGFVGPWYREPMGLGSLRSFPGGLFTTCGLDHILFPETDENDTYNYPSRSATEYGLHGRVSSTPATLRSYGEHWDGGECELRAEGEVRQAGALAENLVLRRTLTVPLDGREIVWEDEVRNEGHYATPHMFLYHMNIGAPLLDAACELVAPIRAVRFETPTVTQPDEHLSFHEPRPGFLEQAFSHDLAPGPDGRASVMLLNHADPDEPWGVVLRFDREQFPFFFQWRYFDAGTYVIGLEPSTNGISGRAAAREAGELTMLEPGEARTYRNQFQIVVGKDETEQVRAEILASHSGSTR